MSSISPAVQSVLQSRHEAVQQQIDISLMGKHLETQKQQGKAVVDLIEQASQIQQQLAAGHLDVKV